MTLNFEHNSVDQLVARLNFDIIGEEQKSALVLLGLITTNDQAPSIGLPNSHSQLLEWDRVGRRLGRQLEIASSLELLRRLIVLRQYFIVVSTKTHPDGWQSDYFLASVNGLLLQQKPITPEDITDLRSGRPVLSGYYAEFDKGLGLACAHFLNRLSTSRKLLGMTAAECCLLYIEGIELIEREVQYPGRLSDHALSVVRTVLCKPDWSVSDSQSTLSFREACAAMIRAMQIAVLESVLASQPNT